MIAIDTAFFLLELVTGFLAHSLALTADAFHMVHYSYNLKGRKLLMTQLHNMLTCRPRS